MLEKEKRLTNKKLQQHVFCRKDVPRFLSKTFNKKDDKTLLQFRHCPCRVVGWRGPVPRSCSWTRKRKPCQGYGASLRQEGAGCEADQITGCTLRWSNIAGWKMDPLQMYFLLKMGIFHCYVCMTDVNVNPVHIRISIFDLDILFVAI